MRDRVAGWLPIERVSALVSDGWRPLFLGATRWRSPAGVEATVVTGRTVGRTEPSFPTIVTVPELARDAGWELDGTALDPQLRWHDIDDRRFVVSPVLGLRLSFKVPRGRSGSFVAGVDRRICRIRFASLPGSDAQGGTSDAFVGAWRGARPGLVTRWPITSGPTIDTVSTAPARNPGLVTGTAVFLRDDRDEPVGVG